MPNYRVLRGDVLAFCRHYRGDKFHALLCDPPYHLTSIVKRFGKNGSKPAKHGKDGAFSRASKGFMGKQWDGGDIAFRSETWSALGKLLHPGAFGMAFASSRGFHRMAVAIEDAGFVIHPMIGWVYGSGFPKATRIRDNAEFDGHRYGLQALKPALEPIIVFQRPYEGRPVDNIAKTGAGALSVDAARIETNSGANETNNLTGVRAEGRWPANVALSHSRDCRRVGMRAVEGYTINRWNDGAKPFGGGAGHEYTTETRDGGEIVAWECVDGCPIKMLNEQAGLRTSGKEPVGGFIRHAPDGNETIYGGGHGLWKDEQDAGSLYGDAGGASRFFFNASWELENSNPIMYCPKANRSERDSGLDEIQPTLYGQSGGAQGVLADGGAEYIQDGIGLNSIKSVRNPHPTIKPISLCKWLAALLLPPPQYSPRSILVPFCGTGSEMIGAGLSGWDCVVGVEGESEYATLANARLKHWIERSRQMELL